MRLENAEEIQSEEGEKMKLVQDDAKDVNPALGDVVEHLCSATALTRQRLETIRQSKWATRWRKDILALSLKHTITSPILGSARMHRSRWAIYMEG